MTLVTILLLLALGGATPAPAEDSPVVTTGIAIAAAQIQADGHSPRLVYSPRKRAIVFGARDRQTGCLIAAKWWRSTGRLAPMRERCPEPEGLRFYR